jgi:steroid delta-isomerase-like uncharacterized protein
MSVEENKRIVRRVNEELISQGKMSVADELFADNFVDHSALPSLPTSREGVKQLFTMFRSAFANFHVTIEDQVAEGSTVATRKTFHGSHSGNFMGFPPTGKEVSFGAIDIMRLDGGKITDYWVQVDLPGLLQQLGVGTAPAEA